MIPDSCEFATQDDDAVETCPTITLYTDELNYVKILYIYIRIITIFFG